MEVLFLLPFRFLFPMVIENSNAAAVTGAVVVREDVYRCCVNDSSRAWQLGALLGECDQIERYVRSSAMKVGKCVV